MLLAIPDFSKSRSEQRAEIIRVEDIRKIIVRIFKDYTELILVKDEPIGKIHVKPEATTVALENLYRIMKMPNNFIRIVMIDKDGKIKVFDKVLEEVLKGGKSEKV